MRVTVLALFALILSGPPALAQEPVAEFQNFLLERGCDVGTADGQWGRRTTAAAQVIAARSGIAIDRPVTTELLDRLEVSTARCDTVAIIERFIPEDVLESLEFAKSQKWLCPVENTKLADIENLEPVDAIAGLQSNMNNQGQVPGMNDLVAMVMNMSALYVRGYVNEDADLKAAMIEKLADWASRGAFMKTVDCGAHSRLDCGQPWQDPSGNDPAPSYDFHATQNSIVHLGLGYDMFLAGYEPTRYAAEHSAIRRWFDFFYDRMHETTRINFGFGVEYNWANLNKELQQNRAADFEARLKRLAEGLDAQIFADGSLKDRTTRGARATGYHFGALNEVFVSLEILKANGIDLYPQLSERLEKSVAIFLNAVDDPTSIYPWAKVNLESPGDYQKQEYNPEGLRYGGGSWMFIYLYRFPGTDNAVRVKALMDKYEMQADQDIGVGAGLQCLYTAGLPQLGGPKPTPKFTFEAATIWVEEEREDRIFYQVQFRKPMFGDKPVFIPTFQLGVGFNGKLGDLKNIASFAIGLDRTALIDRESMKADYSVCSDQSVDVMDNGAQWLQLYLGRLGDRNVCIYDLMTPDESLVWRTMFANFDKIIDSQQGTANAEIGATLRTYYDAL